MVTIESDDAGCSGISFDVTFDIRGKPAASGWTNDPANSLDVHFHSMFVHLGPENKILLDRPSHAIDALGAELYEKIERMAIDVYLEDLAD